MIRLGLEPKTYCLEGSCSIQLSYQTIKYSLLSKIGCKVRHFFGNHQIFAHFSHRKSYVSAVVEGIVASEESFCGLELADVQRVLLALTAQPGLRLFERRAEEGIAVGGEHDLLRTEVERDDGHELLRYGEAVDDGIGDVLILHLLQHVGDNGGAGLVVGQDIVGALALHQQLAHPLRPHPGKHLFVGLGILEEAAIDEALAVAHHPYLPPQPGEDDGRGGEPLLGVFRKPRDHLMLVGTPEGDVDVAYGSCCAYAELVAGVAGRHAADVAGDGAHGSLAVAHRLVPFAPGLRGGAVDHGDEVICDDDSVLAFPGGVLRDDVLFDDVHISRVMAAQGRCRVS